MTLLFDIAPCIPPVSAQTTGADLYQRFHLEPDTLAIAVVDPSDRPIGLVERNAFLVLMDIKMPGIDGVEAMRRIRSGGGPAAQVPILALTANADSSDAAYYRQCGMDGVVEKPIKPEKLLAAMNAVLRLDSWPDEVEAAEVCAA